ncbi:MAG: ABC transporter ATP-binding protein, partial [Acidobacteria bacterium]|nr:ABC transporter ATP-binding protein [Acidobacteriota bacterium]
MSGLEREIAISVRKVGKVYRIYDRPEDRLRQMLFARFGKSYGRDFCALRDVSFEVYRREALGIIGRNGSGKSTLLQILAGTLSPTWGEVKVQGRVAALLELGSGFNPEFTGRENVYLNASLLGMTKKQTDARFDEIASFAEIGDFIDQPVKTYSSGMVIRLAFAVQTAIEPEILIIDEALSVGDFFFQQKCARRMRELREKGTTLLFVSHDMAVV